MPSWPTRKIVKRIYRDPRRRVEAGAMKRVWDEKRRNDDVITLYDIKNNLKADDGRITKRPVWLRAIGRTK